MNDAVNGHTFPSSLVVVTTLVRFCEMTLLGGGQRRFGFATRRRARRLVLMKSTPQSSHFSSLCTAHRALVLSALRVSGLGEKSWSMSACSVGSGAGICCGWGWGGRASASAAHREHVCASGTSCAMTGQENSATSGAPVANWTQPHCDRAKVCQRRWGKRNEFFVRQSAL